MSKTIHAIRHGQAQHNMDPPASWYNPEFKFSSLTPLGIEQACTAPKLEVDGIYVSPLRRTLQTAFYMFGSVPMIALPELRETNLDHIVNTHEDRADLEAQYPHVDFSRVDITDVGRYRDDHQTKIDVLFTILRESPCETIAIVSHCDLLMSVFERLELEIETVKHVQPYAFRI